MNETRFIEIRGKRVLLIDKRYPYDFETDITSVYHLMTESKPRIHTWRTPWKIWWWFGYHGLYQINWLWKGDRTWRDLRWSEWFYIFVWYELGCLLLRYLIKLIL